MVRFSVYWESFCRLCFLVGFFFFKDEFLHFFGLVNYLPYNTCTFLFQEIHDLFKDYEIKYCYVDRNKRTGKNFKSSSIICFNSVIKLVRNIICYVWSHRLICCHVTWLSLSAFFGCIVCHILLKPVGSWKLYWCQPKVDWSTVVSLGHIPLVSVSLGQS